MLEDYISARKEGVKELHALESRGKDPYLPVLAELVPKLNQLTQVSLGLVQIALDQIAGTATKGRTTAFSRSFLPLLEPDSEFATKWSILYDGIIEDGLRQTDCKSPCCFSVGWESRTAGLFAPATMNSDQMLAISCLNSFGLLSTLSL